MRTWLVLSIMLFSPALVHAQTQWHSVKATNTISGYSVSEGNAELAMAGDQFTAKLFWKGSDTNLQILLKGTIKAGRITVEETLQESDSGGSTYHGTLREKKWAEFAGTVGGESITLSDGWGMIGITRGIQK
jgi:hypothetical protein